MDESETRAVLPLLMRAPWWIAVLRGPDHHIEFVNAALRSALGAREIAQRSLQEAFPDLDATIRASLVEALRSRRPHFGFDVPVTFDWLGDGGLHTRYLSFACQPLEGRAEDDPATIAIALDVTDLVEKSSHRGAWPGDVLDAIPVPTMLVEPGTRRVIFANAAARALDGPAVRSGTTFGQAVGLDTGYYCTDADGRRVAEDQMPSMRASRGESVDAFEMHWHTPAATIPMLCFASRVEATEHDGPYVVLSFFDVTELRRLERDIQRAGAARQEFVSIAAHELRTPLTALQLHVQALRRAAPEAKGVDSIERATRRMAEIVEQLVEVAQIAGGAGVELSLEANVDLVAILTASAARLAPKLETAGSTLSIAGVSMALGRWDKRRIEQVVEHLLSNAIRFGAGRPIRVECADGDLVATFSVSDGGPGVAPEDRERVFELFERASSPNHYGGFGVGLWLCKRIIVALGGTLELESPPGGGATFRTTLPKRGPLLDAEPGTDGA